MTTAPRIDSGARDGEVRCPVCGCGYDPSGQAACAGCPLNHGCALTCCPACGFSSADPSASALVRVLGRLRRRP